MQQLIRNRYGILNTRLPHASDREMLGQYKFGAQPLGQLHAEIFEHPTQNLKVMSTVKKMNNGPDKNSRNYSMRRGTQNYKGKQQPTAHSQQTQDTKHLSRTPRTRSVDNINQGLILGKRNNRNRSSSNTVLKNFNFKNKSFR